MASSWFILDHLEPKWGGTVGSVGPKRGSKEAKRILRGGRGRPKSTKGRPRETKGTPRDQKGVTVEAQEVHELKMVMFARRYN